MRLPITVALILALTIATGCRRNRPIPPPTKSSIAPTQGTRNELVSTDNRSQLVVEDDPDPFKGEPPPTFDDPPAQPVRPASDALWKRDGQSQPQSQPPQPTRPAVPTLPARPANARGTMIISIYGTPLDFRLDHLRLHNGTFELRGQGVRFVGQMSANWQERLGKPIAINTQITGLGHSELELPQVGTTRIQGGQIVLDRIMSRDPARVAGRIGFVLQGPEGPSSFSGTFEVGIVTE